MKALDLVKNKYVLLVFVLGLALLLLPRTSKTTAGAVGGDGGNGGLGDPLEVSGIPLDTESARLAALLEEMSGVGSAEVLLSRNGAVVVCAGGDDVRVRLAVTNAVAAYTGLGSDQITVMKMNEAGGKEK